MDQHRLPAPMRCSEHRTRRHRFVEVDHDFDDPVVDRPATGLEHRAEQRLRAFEQRNLVEIDLREIYDALLCVWPPGPLPARRRSR
jgi:hypothetical protein